MILSPFRVPIAGSRADKTVPTSRYGYDQTYTLNRNPRLLSCLAALSGSSGLVLCTSNLQVQLVGSVLKNSFLSKQSLLLSFPLFFHIFKLLINSSKIGLQSFAGTAWWSWRIGREGGGRKVGQAVSFIPQIRPERIESFLHTGHIPLIRINASNINLGTAFPTTHLLQPTSPAVILP